MTNTDYPREAASLGIVPPHERRSVGYCVWFGLLWVNGPVAAIMMAGYAIFIGAAKAGLLDRIEAQPNWGGVFGVGLIVYVLFGPPLLAWIWWSSSVSKWRIWALQNVLDWRRLESSSVSVGLIWPRGHFFERTEFKSPEQRELERALITYRDKHG